MFLRAQEFSGGADNDPDRTSVSAIATVQNDTLGNHTHTMNEGGEHDHKLGRFTYDGSGSTAGANGQLDNEDAQTHEAGKHNHTINPTGASETRPKNLNFWIYIRIN